MFGFKRKPLKTSELETQEVMIRNFIQSAAENNRYTPDIARLEQYRFQCVFIYNEMKSGHRSQNILPKDKVQRDAVCYTDGHFVLHTKRLGKASQAIATDADLWPHPFGATAFRARVQGELYIVPSTHIRVLDAYHRNTIEFERRRVRIVRPWRQIVKAKDGFPLNGQILESFKARGIVHSMRGCGTMDAWMYVGCPGYWENLLARQFSPTRVFRSPNEGWLREYYAFTPKEYDFT